MLRKKRWVKYICLWLVGGSLYYLTEMIYRGQSHPAMFIVGGLAFLLCGVLNEGLSWDTPLVEQILWADFGVVILEFVSGWILNIQLGLDIWDYSLLPWNLMGQICLPYALLWLPLCLIGIVLDDYLRWKFFGEEKPRYHWL
jgi:uncharacterized membrane protein